MNGAPVRILLAEDNLSHAKLVMRSLQDYSVANEVIHVTDGELALDYLFNRNNYADEELYSLPDVLLLDLRLPKVDGLDVLKKIKSNAKLRKMPVVILTTSGAESDVAKAYELNANSYLVKPVDFKSFTKLMQDLGFYWLVWNHSPHVP